MKVLVIGSSFAATLKLAEDYFTNSGLVTEISYSLSSIEAWCASDVVIRDGCLQFSVEPNELFASVRPLPHFVKQLNDKAVLVDFDVIVVGQIGMMTRNAFFDAYRHPRGSAVPARTPISASLLYALEHSVNGDYSNKREVSWAKYVVENHFSARRFLALLAANSQGVKKFYIATHPEFNEPGLSDAALSLRKVSWSDYLEHWSDLTSRLGFHFLRPPVEALQDNQCFTRLEYSANPERRDLHLNQQYGQLLWKSIIDRLQPDARKS